MEFFHDILAMCDNGCDTDVQSVGNFLIDESLGKEDGHFDLTGGKHTLMNHPRSSFMGRHTMWMSSPMYCQECLHQLFFCLAHV